ncbi:MULTISPECIES: hypothetical protein [unclassified Microcoleus]|uniref:hypothetical protein n=1 Tax=unclassified Microcoleus TaxID=2642155 RepID=UPI002FCE6DEF
MATAAAIAFGAQTTPECLSQMRQMRVALSRRNRPLSAMRSRLSASRLPLAVCRQCWKSANRLLGTSSGLPASEKRSAQRVAAGFLAIDCYAKSGNPPSAGYVNNSYCS